MLFTPNEALKVKEKYPPGSRVVLDYMGDDPNPIEPGEEGTVIDVDSLGTIHVAWDNGRKLGLVLGEDTYHLAKERVSPERNEGR